MVNRIAPLLLFFSCILFATDKTFVREYTYKASDYDSKVTSRANALEQVKRLLLEEVSVFIKSEINMETTEELIDGEYEFKDFYEQKITSITAGITETKILDEKWTGVVYWMKAEITIDPDDIKSKIDQIVQNKEKLKELEDVNKKADDALVEIERLKKELAEAKSDADQLRLTKAYNKEIDILSATDWFQKGNNAIENKEYDKAISFLLRAIDLEPDCAVCYFSLGLAYYGEAKYSKAIPIFVKAIELDIDKRRVNFIMGDAYYRLNNYAKAIQFYEKAIELGPEYFASTKGYIWLGFSYYMEGDYSKAIPIFVKAIELDIEKPRAYALLGLIYGEQGKPELKLLNHKKAAKLGYQPAQNWLKEDGYDW